MLNLKLSTLILVNDMNGGPRRVYVRVARILRQFWLECLQSWSQILKNNCCNFLIYLFIYYYS